MKASPKEWPRTEIRYEDEGQLRAWLEQYIQSHRLREYYAFIDWDAVIEAYISGQSMPEIKPTPEEIAEAYKKLRWPIDISQEKLTQRVETEITNLISYMERVTGLPRPEFAPATAEEWLDSLSAEERADRDSFVNNQKQRISMLTNQPATEEFIRACDEYLFSFYQAASALENEIQGMIADLPPETSDEERARVVEDFIMSKMESGELEVTLPDLLRDTMDDVTYSQKVQAQMKAIPQECFALVDARFPDMHPTVRNILARQLQVLGGNKAREAQRITGTRPLLGEALNKLTDEEVNNALHSSLSTFLAPTVGEEPLSLITPMSQLQRVARYTGMGEWEYVQSAFQDWKARLSPDFIGATPQDRLWREFISEEGHRLGERDSLIGYIEADLIEVSEAEGAERKTLRERLTPLYEYVPPTEPEMLSAPTGAVRWAEKYQGIPAEELYPTGTPGGWQKAAGQPPGEITGGPSAEDVNVDWTQAQARAAYISEIKKRGYGPEDVAYLSQFFNTFAPGPWPKKLPRWQIKEAFENIEIPSPPRREAPKTRFLRRR